MDETAPPAPSNLLGLGKPQCVGGSPKNRHTPTSGALSDGFPSNHRLERVPSKKNTHTDTFLLPLSRTPHPKRSFHEACFDLYRISLALMIHRPRLELRSVATWEPHACSCRKEEKLGPEMVDIIGHAFPPSTVQAVSYDNSCQMFYYGLHDQTPLTHSSQL